MRARAMRSFFIFSEGVFCFCCLWIASVIEGGPEHKPYRGRKGMRKLGMVASHLPGVNAAGQMFPKG